MLNIQDLFNTSYVGISVDTYQFSTDMCALERECRIEMIGSNAGCVHDKTAPAAQKNVLDEKGKKKRTVKSVKQPTSAKALTSKKPEHKRPSCFTREELPLVGKRLGEFLEIRYFEGTLDSVSSVECIAYLHAHGVAKASIRQMEAGGSLHGVFIKKRQELWNLRKSIAEEIAAAHLRTDDDER